MCLCRRWVFNKTLIFFIYWDWKFNNFGALLESLIDVISVRNYDMIYASPNFPYSSKQQENYYVIVTSSNVTFSALLAICAGNSPVTGEFPAQRPVTGGFDVFFDLRMNKWLSRQWRGWWFDTPSRSLWRYCNVARVSRDIRDISSWHLFIYI